MTQSRFLEALLLQQADGELKNPIWQKNDNLKTIREMRAHCECTHTQSDLAVCSSIKAYPVKEKNALDCGFCQIVDCLTHHIAADYG